MNNESVRLLNEGYEQMAQLATFYQREWMLAVMGREPTDDERIADWQQRLRQFSAQAMKEAA